MVLSLIVITFSYSSSFKCSKIVPRYVCTKEWGCNFLIVLRLIFSSGFHGTFEKDECYWSVGNIMVLIDRETKDQQAPILLVQQWIIHWGPMKVRITCPLASV